MRVRHTGRLLAIAAAAGVAPVAHAQTDAGAGAGADHDLTRRVAVSFGLGSARQRLDRGAGTAVVDTRLLATGRLVAWLRPTWAFESHAAFMGGAGGGGALTAVLFGAAWYPAAGGVAGRVRPYASASAGLFLRSGRRAGTTLAVGRARGPTDAVPAARLAAGLDAFLTERLVLGIAAGYVAAGRFEALDPRQGAAVRPAGPMATASVGVLLPRRDH